jgi:hypothetical protein
MARASIGAGLAALCLAAFGCGASGVANSVVADMERVRTSPAVTDGARVAPQQVAMAEYDRALSLKASHDGDETLAALYATQAIAAYTDAVVLARWTRATVLGDQASADLAGEQARGLKLSAERAQAEKQADELDTKLKVAQESISPIPSGKADPEREAARSLAARALVAQARLLCGAARLVSPSLDGQADLDRQVDVLDAELAKPVRPTPIDAAARVRAGCLSLLTHARRTTANRAATDPDALLAELSATGEFSPSRDERGILVVLRDTWNGTALTPAASKVLADLGRVAQAHPAFGVQVVVHDATPPSAADAARDTQRASAATAALVAAGATASHVGFETPGAGAPLVDPADAAHRARNARLEIVFVGGVSSAKE